MEELIPSKNPSQQETTEPGMNHCERATRVRALWPLACVAFLVGSLIALDGWLGFSNFLRLAQVGTGIAIVLAAIVLFWGRTRALQLMLPFGRVYLLLFAPLFFWPWWQLRIWEAPWPIFKDWIRYDALAHILIVVVLVMAEVTRWFMRLPLRPVWTAGPLLVALAFIMVQRFPIYRARAEIDPAAREQARLLIAGFHEDPYFSYRSGWWDKVPWNTIEATPAWERPVMRCEFISWRDGMSIGEGESDPGSGTPDTVNRRAYSSILSAMVRTGGVWKWRK